MKTALRIIFPIIFILILIAVLLFVFLVRLVNLDFTETITLNYIYADKNIHLEITEPDDFNKLVTVCKGIAINDLRLIQSLMLRLGMKTSVFPVVKTPVSIEPFVLGAWKFSNAITGNGSLMFFDFGLGISL